MQCNKKIPTTFILFPMFEWFFLGFLCKMSVSLGFIMFC